MKYGINSFLWTSPFNENDLDKVKHAKELGFGIIEIPVEKLELIDEQLLCETGQKNDIEIFISGAFNNFRDLSSFDEEVYFNAKSYIKKLIDIASIVGSPYVSGPMYAATGKTMLMSEDQKLCRDLRVTKAIKELAVYAKSKGIKLAIEPLNRFETDYINTVSQAMVLLNDIEEDNVGLLLDTFHMNIEERSIADAIKLAGEKIYSIHASSNDRGTPGSDNIDWDEIKDSLDFINYDGPIIIEAFTHDVSDLLSAASLWRKLYETQDDLAINGLNFLKETFK